MQERPYQPGQVCIVTVDPGGTNIGRQFEIASTETMIVSEHAMIAHGMLGPWRHAIGLTIQHIMPPTAGRTTTRRCYWPIRWMVPIQDPDADQAAAQRTARDVEPA